MKAFNHLRPDLVAGDPASDGGLRVLFHSGDDAHAKAEIGALIDRLGFFGSDLGALALSRRLTRFPGGPLPSTSSNSADRLSHFKRHGRKPPMSTQEPDYDHLLRANLERIFNDRDAHRRTQAIEELFAADPVMYEPDGIVTGREGISAVAGKLLDQFRRTFRFTPVGPGVGHHGLAVLRWEAGPDSGPIAVTGSDAARTPAAGSPSSGCC